MGQMSTYMQICVQARSEDFKRGGGRDFKCCCVSENFEKLTLSGAFSDHFFPIFALSEISPKFPQIPQRVSISPKIGFLGKFPQSWQPCLYSVTV